MSTSSRDVLLRSRTAPLLDSLSLRAARVIKHDRGEMPVARTAQDEQEPNERPASGRRNQRIGLRRLVGWAAFLPLASRAPIYGRLFWELVLDERTPATRKAMLAAALGYLVLGRDIVPDDLPIVGGLDDLVVVVVAVDLFLDGVPSDVLDEKLDLLGIDRRAFLEDVARIRRFTPGPLRRALRSIPRALAFAGDTLDNAGLGSKVRTWINKEESIA
jgi:uncharacterized membrane protein YkvA (DUF1232 family)